MKQFRVYNSEKGFYMWNECLTEITLVKVVFERYKVYDDNVRITTVFKTPDGVEHAKVSQEDNFFLFDNEKDYEKNKIASNYCIEPFKFRPRGIQKDEAWIFVDGEPNAIDIRPLRIEYDYSKAKLHHELENSLLFNSKEECLSFNEYDVKYSDGSTTKRVGINKLVMLDEDQRVLFKRLKDTITELQKAGVLLVPDCDGCVEAFNFRKIEKWNIDSDSNEDDYEDDYEEIARGHRLFDSYYIGSYCDDYGIFVKRKK